LGIPLRVKGDSSGKPNGIPAKANSRRSEAALAVRLCRKVFGFVNDRRKRRRFPGAKRRSFGRDLGCRGKGRPLYPLLISLEKHNSFLIAKA
jgi:hypothetical protein